MDIQMGTPVEGKIQSYQNNIQYQIISNRKNVSYPNLIFDGIGIVINPSVEHVHLGLTITSNLSWQRHIDKVIFKANKIIYVMNDIKTKLARNALCALYSNPCCCLS